MPDDADAPPVFDDAPMMSVQEDTPVGFWADLVSAVRQELKPPVSGFFVATPNAPVIGVLSGNTLVLRCTNPFTLGMIDTVPIRELVGRKASAILGRQVMVKAEDTSARPDNNAAMERLLSFSREHSDIVNIKNT